MSFKFLLLRHREKQIWFNWRSYSITPSMSSTQFMTTETNRLSTINLIKSDWIFLSRSSDFGVEIKWKISLSLNSGDCGDKIINHFPVATLERDISIKILISCQNDEYRWLVSWEGEWRMKNRENWLCNMVNTFGGHRCRLRLIRCRLATVKVLFAYRKRILIKLLKWRFLCNAECRDWKLFSIIFDNSFGNVLVETVHPGCKCEILLYTHVPYKFTQNYSLSDLFHILIDEDEQH